MKKNKLLLTFCALFLIGGTAISCAPQTSSSSSTSSVNPSQIIIGGPKSVKVGQQITLVADIVGDDDDIVDWSTTTPDILSIDQQGVVTGISAGEGQVEAFSSQYNLKATYAISVTQDYATEIELVILNEDEIDITVLENGTFKVPVGQTVELGFKVKGENVSTPDSASYSIVDASEEASNIELTTNSDMTGTLIFKKAYENIAIKVSASYISSIEQPLVSTKYFTSFDINADVVLQVNEIFGNLLQSESSSASYAEVDYEYQTGDETSSSNLTINYYQDAVYSALTSGDSTTHTYSHIDKTRQMYYLFDYDYETKNIVSIYNTLNYDSDKESTYEQQANLGHFFVNQGVATFGFANILSNILNNPSYRSYSSLGDYRALAYASFDITDTKITITSSYIDEYDDSEYTFELIVNFSQNQLSNYSYEVQQLDNGVTNIFKETGFVEYDGKATDNSATNPDYIDLSRYYVSDFDIKDIVGETDPDGKWDFSNTSKYGFSDMQEDGNREVTYYIPYYKALPLQLYNIAPSTASLDLDSPSVVGISSNGKRTFYANAEGIFAISAPKDAETGASLKIEETITITTLGGATFTINCIFVDEGINAIIFSDGNACLDETTFNDVFVGFETGYFYLNTDPDDILTYTFELDITSGDEDGLELFQFGDDNIMGYPGFAYGLKANKVGTYKFRFHVVGTDVYSNEFTINVLKLFDDDYIKDKIIGKTYYYTTGNSNYYLTFTNEETITLETIDLYGSTLSASITYSINSGKVTISGEQQYFTQPFYFSKVKGGDILFDTDFESVTLYLEIYSAAYPEGIDYYSGYTFTLKKDISDIMSYVNGNSYTSSANIYPFIMCTLVLSFNDGKGEIAITSNSSGQVVDTIHFDYEFEESSSTFIFKNAVSDNGAITLKNERQSFYLDSGSLQIWINSNANSLTYQYRIDFSLF